MNQPESKEFWTKLQENASDNDIVDLAREWISFNTKENGDDDSFEEERSFFEENSFAEDCMDDGNVNADNLNNQMCDSSFSSFMDFNNKIMIRQLGLLLNDKWCDWDGDGI